MQCGKTERRTEEIAPQPQVHREGELEREAVQRVLRVGRQQHLVGQHRGAAAAGVRHRPGHGAHDAVVLDGEVHQVGMRGAAQQAVAVHAVGREVHADARAKGDAGTGRQTHRVAEDHGRLLVGNPRRRCAQLVFRQATSAQGLFRCDAFFDQGGDDGCDALGSVDA
ncbi:hypothetical protein D3C72_1789330 [compost metagenome]